MSTVFWHRLQAAAAELTTAPADHPDRAAPDVDLFCRLETPTPDEGGYVVPAVDTQDYRLEHDGGQYGVRAYFPPARCGAVGLRPLFVWVHGGGWSGGDLDGAEADATAREVCMSAGAVVVSVEYRLARDGVCYPIPLDDVAAAWTWAVGQSESWEIDPGRRVLGGASAGANLAAGCVLRLVDAGLPLPNAAILAYPAMHAELPPPATDATRAALDRIPRWLGHSGPWYAPMVENYLGGPTSSADEFSMPGGSTRLSSFPPTLVVNCEYDGLRTSGEMFANQLRTAGVTVVEELARDVLHGHLSRAGHPEAMRTIALMSDWIAGVTA